MVVPLHIMDENQIEVMATTNAYSITVSLRGVIKTTESLDSLQQKCWNNSGYKLYCLVSFIAFI